MNNDKAILFESKCLEAKRIINSLKEIGINADSFNNALDNIKDNVKNDINNQNEIISLGPVQSFNQSLIEQAYIKGIAKIELLMMELNKYEVYFKSFYTTQSIKDIINKDVDKETLNKIVFDIINIILAINESNTRNYEHEKEIVENIYETAYKVMKLEFRINQDSKLFEFAKDNEILKNYFNREIEKDIDKLKSNNLVNNLITNIVNKIKSNGINYDYLNESLLLYLSIENEVNIEEVIKNLKDIIEKIDINNDSINKNNKDIYIIKERLDYYNEKVKDNTKTIIKSIIKLTVFASITAGIIIGSRKIAKHGSKIYKTTTSNYSTSDVIESTTTEEYKDTLEDSVVIKEYTPYIKTSDGFKRNVFTYDVSNIKCEDLKEYLNIDLEELGIKKDSTTERKNSLDLNDLYKENTTEVIKINQDKEDFYYDKEALIGITILLSLMFNGLLYLFDYILFKNTDDSLFFDSIDELRFIDNIYIKERISKNNKTLKEFIEKEKILLQNNEELRKRFITIFDKYKELINDKELIENYQRLLKK